MNFESRTDIPIVKDYSADDVYMIIKDHPAMGGMLVSNTEKFEKAIDHIASLIKPNENKFD